MLITESLTKKRMRCIQKMKILRHEAVITSYWTVDGKVFYSLPNDPKKKNTWHHYNQMILFKIKMLFTIVQVSSDTWMDCFFVFLLGCQFLFYYYWYFEILCLLVP